MLSLLAELPMSVPIVAAQGEPRSASGIPVASVNQEAGAKMVLEHLIERGHTRILHVAGPPDWNDAQLRLRAYKAELQAAGLPSSPPLFGRLDRRLRLRDRLRADQRYRELPPRGTAVHRGVLLQ